MAYLLASILLAAVVSVFVFRCSKCRFWYVFRTFGWHGSLSGRTFCKACYENHVNRGRSLMELL